MAKLSVAICILLGFFMLSGCGETDGIGLSEPPKRINVSGAVQKGPFVIGSTVTVNRLSEQGENTDSTIVTNTTDDLGVFDFFIDRAGLVQISSTGYYRNEITGELSSGTLTLRSIYQATASEGQYAYVNLLTHIISNRILNLIKNTGVSFDSASSQAEVEFLSSFSVVIPNTVSDDFTSLTIFGDQKSLGSSYLLAISSILYQYAINKSLENATNPDAELTLLANKLESDFGDDGVIDDSSLLGSIKEVIPHINPDEIQRIVNGWAVDSSGGNFANINEYLDSDLDGVFNVSDQDDDNDGMDDVLDPSPYVPGFLVSNQKIISDEDVSIVIDASSNNPMNSVIDLKIVQWPNNGTLVGNYPSLTYIPNSNYSGVDEFKYILTQLMVTSEVVTVSITIQPVNDSPVISGVPSNEAIANSLYSFTPSVINVENDKLLFSIENSPVWASFDEVTGRLSGIPSNSNANIYENIVITVSDGILAVSLDSFSINVVANPWIGLTEMPTGRHSPAVAVLGAELFVVGGFSNSALSIVETYNTASNSWETKSSTQASRVGHTAHTIQNNIVVVGGTVEGNNSVESYNKTDGLWVLKSPMNTPRNNHAGCTHNGKLYIFGGRMSNYTALKSVEMYDFETDVWVYKTPLGTSKWGMSCSTVGDLIYVFGGAENEMGYEIYNVISDSWEASGSLNSPRRYGFSASVINSDIYLIGGYECAGGIGCSSLNAVEVLDINSGQWATKTSMPVDRHDIGYGVINDSIYLVGGRNSNSNNLGTLERYSPLLD